MGVHQRLLTFTTVNQNGFGRSWGDNDEIGDLPDSDDLRVFQIPASQQNAKSGTMARWETCIIVLLLRCSNRIFGTPLVIRTRIHDFLRKSKSICSLNSRCIYLFRVISAPRLHAKLFRVSTLSLFKC